MQHRYYEQSDKKSDNIHRWQRTVIQSMLDFGRELWKIRCGYINAETILTSTQILRQRTQKMHNENNQKKELVPIIDRHLFEKDDAYFLNSSTETLEIWESKAKEALRKLDDAPHDQPTMAATMNRIRREYIIPDEVDTDHAPRKKRKHQFCSNPDPIWHKRLKISYIHQRQRKRKKHRRVRRRKAYTTKHGRAWKKMKRNKSASTSRKDVHNKNGSVFNFIHNLVNSEWS